MTHTSVTRFLSSSAATSHARNAVEFLRQSRAIGRQRLGHIFGASLRRLTAGVLVCAALVFAAHAEPPSQPLPNFDSAKKVARNVIYSDRPQDIYCGCDYIPTGASGGAIDPAGCGYVPRANAARGGRLEWEHIVPAWFFGHSRGCWQSGDPECVTSSGDTYKGRRCCARVDNEFRRIEADLHNLAPSVGELNGDRSNLPYGIVDGEPRNYGACDFEIGGNPKVAEPAEIIRGDVARIWLYMADTYGIELPAEMRGMFEAWSAADPPDELELLRDARIEAAQGNRNPFLR